MVVKYNWFPGHMAKAMREIKERLKPVDLVLEIRDARIPFTSANDKLDALLRHKRRIVVLNKSDLADPKARAAAQAQLASTGGRVASTCAQQPSTVQALLAAALGWLRTERARSDFSIMMVVGVPNCGKSALINALKTASHAGGTLAGEEAYGKTAVTGPTPGVTKQMSAFQVGQDPLVYILDTPGVMLPKIQDNEAALKLALTGAIKEEIIGTRELVKYLLQLLQQPHHRAVLQRLVKHHADKQLRGTTSGREQAAGVTSDVRSAMRGSRNSSGAGPRGASAKAGAVNVQKLGTALLRAVDVNVKNMAWHPGVEDDAFDPGNLRLEHLLASLKAVGGTDPGKEDAACNMIVKAFRGGELGRYMLDTLEQHADPPDKQT